MAITRVRGNTQLQFDGDLDLQTNKIVNLVAGTAATDAVNKSQLDNVSAGLDPKESCQLASTANLTLSGEQTIDGVLTSGSRILVKDQTAGLENGIYVTGAGAWTRATDADVSAEVTAGMYCFVTEGTVNADIGFVLTTDDPITLDTTALVFSQFTGAGSVNAASETVAGIAEIATQAETDAGTDDLRFVTPLKLATYSGLTAKLEASNFVYNEQLTVTNGAAAVSALANTQVAGTVAVYLNGVRQLAGGANDYTITGQVITFNFTLKNNGGNEDVVVVDYQK